MSKKVNKLHKQSNTNKCSGGGGNFSCRHPKLYKWLISNLKAFFIGGAISFVVTASATVILHSRQVRYKNDKSVEQAINELYEKAEQLPKKYKIGDEIKVHNISFYVIADSPRNQDYVVALKKDALTVSEVQLYGNGHINRYTRENQDTVLNSNGYGIIVYFSSETCGWVDNNWSFGGCKNDYNISDVKYVVDNWTNDNFNDNELVDIEGYISRLMYYNEALSLGCTGDNNSCNEWSASNKYHYWIIGPNPNQNLGYLISQYHKIKDCGGYGIGCISRANFAVRPVINVKKSAIQK